MGETNADKLNGMKGYEATHVRMNEETVTFLGKVWNKRLRMKGQLYISASRHAAQDSGRAHHFH